ncbi:DNA internalization-related competence protein ComEC/Rec2 [Psychrosphaera saromensis]|nr:DNA internalization-related competence protein ComEC/Rec2 [Psychrosphaera saromensis]GLQ14141.1 DNA internalization-related competence protein ComEC/Rec2 [Psychrosphaera saromensis]
MAGVIYLMAMSNFHFNNNFVTAQAQTFDVQGQVSSVVVKKQNNPSLMFTIKVATINGEPVKSSWFPTLLRVSWFKPKLLLQQGDLLTATIKLTKPHGYQNRFGFDYNQWVFSKGFIATGSIKKIHSHSSLKELNPTQLNPSKQQPLEFKFLQQNLLQQGSVNKLIEATQGINSQGVMLAVGLGNRSLITNEQFELYNHMGISHLLAISGLHIGIIFLVIKWLLKLVAKGWLTLTRLHLNHKYLTMFTLILLWSYIGLISFPVSATRAGLFVSLWALLDLTFSNINKIKLLLLVAFFSLLIDPFSPLTAAWWLTFSAVLGIVIFIQKVPFVKVESSTGLSIKELSIKNFSVERESIKALFTSSDKQEQESNPEDSLKWQLWQNKLFPIFRNVTNRFIYLLKFQVFITVWMMPVVLFWFGGVSVSSVLTNLIAIPIFSFILVPSIFVGTVGALLDISWLHYLFVFADAVLSPLLNMFSRYSVFHYWIDFAFGVWSWWLLIICIVLILPVYVLNRSRASKVVLSVLLVLPVGLSFYPWHSSLITQFKPKLTMYVLDVGQGTSVLFKQGSSAFIYDLGPVYPSGFNATQAVVKPMLIGLGITDVAHIVVSHNDSDHTGDINVLGDTSWIATRKQSCKPQTLTWFNTEITMLWPEQPRLNHSFSKQTTKNKNKNKNKNELSKNDSSCVIKITDKLTNSRVLLTGDITSKIERRLLAMHNKAKIDLESDVIISAHHGSKYSSAQAFINAVSPEIVFHSAGVNNRFGFPTTEVIDRFDLLNAQYTKGKSPQRGLPQLTQYSTNTQGMLEVVFTQTDQNSTKSGVIVTGYLDHWQPFWKKQNPFRFTSKIR